MPKLKDNGRVINISSVASRIAGQNFAAYSICKAALEMFTRVLAKDLGPRGITVNSVAPGFTAGETNAHIVEDTARVNEVIAQTALRRFGQEAEIADFVYALASPAGRWITSQNIEASGGFML
jgi:NAD(P)-dependent dehydrogenase (short-subunit alcohol dehydrogenase family)